MAIKGCLIDCLIKAAFSGEPAQFSDLVNYFYKERIEQLRLYEFCTLLTISSPLSSIFHQKKICCMKTVQLIFKKLPFSSGSEKKTIFAMLSLFWPRHKKSGISFSQRKFLPGADLGGGGAGGRTPPPLLRDSNPCQPKGSPLWYFLRNPFLANRP